jgi:hypothetical protein
LFFTELEIPLQNSSIPLNVCGRLPPQRPRGRYVRDVGEIPGRGFRFSFPAFVS